MTEFVSADAAVSAIALPAQAWPLVQPKDTDGVRVLTAANGKVNALSRPLRVALLTALAEASGADVRAIVLRCAGRTFFAGADLQELDSGFEPPGLLEFVDACAAAPQPVVAALHGTVFGGGVVMAYACDWRVAAHDARFAMPEVALGLLPTFGGTQLLPRLVGVPAALELVLDGVQWDAAAALRHGLVDEVVPAANLGAAALAAARRMPPKRPVRRERRHLEEPARAAQALAVRRSRMEETLKVKGRTEAEAGLPAAAQAATEAQARCLAVMAEGLGLPLEQALALEHAAFLELLASPASRLLRQRFFAEREQRRAGPDGQGREPERSR